MNDENGITFSLIPIFFSAELQTKWNQILI